MASPANTEILIVDDEPGLREVLEITFRRHGYSVVTAASARAAVQAIADSPAPFPVVVTDLVMPGGSGMDVLRAARERCPSSQVIVITAYSTVESAIDAMRQGAYDFVTKPFSPAELAALASKAIEKSAIVAENEKLRARIAKLDSGNLDDEIGQSPAMRAVGSLVARIAPTRTTVLITGESGTGKERMARLIHRLSNRAAGSFCVINCGALPEALMESELFGHERGAFTGAERAAPGMFREAHGGTLLLDEVGELPSALQVKLLRVLQERKVRPVGSSTELAVDVRLLAATNRDVEQDVAQGRFRKDLYYRLNVIRIKIPPLREREQDVRRLAERFVRFFAAEQDRPVRGLSTEALRAIETYDFPGNVRELENMMERAVALASGPWLRAEDLPEAVGGHAPRAPRSAELAEQGCDLDDVLAQTERSFLEQALERAGGERKSAARLLGISFRSLRYRLAKLGIDAPSSPEPGSPGSDDG
ncbi:MAG: sigma-54-dependent Fis family transcriptional regulator [Deltaproteobacteria bacterium]|nr:sigma-54-dependent Fis family transcriptional regulator [Deltaproteobacteria bacterium]